MSNGIITLCGSTRFYKLFDEMNYRLTMNGYIVLSIGCHTNHDACLGITEIEGAEETLDILHKEKIAMSDAVLILDKDGYIGNSTRSELVYAKQLGKRVFYYDNRSFLNLLAQPVTIRELKIKPLANKINESSSESQK